MTSGWGGDTRPLVLRGEKEAESETKRIAHETNTREKIGATTRMGQGAEGTTTINNAIRLALLQQQQKHRKIR